MNKSQRTKAIFAQMGKNSCFFVQNVYFVVEKGGLSEKSLEGWYTYKPKKMRYNVLSRVDIRNPRQRMELQIHPKAEPDEKKNSKERSESVKKKKAAKYSPDLPGRMYLYFISYEDRGAPSFLKFARSAGISSEDIERFRSHKSFDRAYRECQEIRRDYLIDRALDKRFDPGFTKFLLSIDLDRSDKEDINDFTLTLEVKE